MVIKMTKNDSFFEFSAADSKKLVIVSEKFLRYVLLENGMVSRPWSYRSWIEGRNIKKTVDNTEYRNAAFLRAHILHLDMVCQNNL